MALRFRKPTRRCRAGFLLDPSGNLWQHRDMICREPSLIVHAFQACGLTGSEFRLIVLDRWQVSLSGAALPRCTTVADIVDPLGSLVED
jgi:hypothetical protein